MFEAVELGRTVSKDEFNTQEPGLRMQLLEAQRALREAQVPLIVIVSGVEGAGKGEVVKRLYEWWDARGIRTHAFWDETDDERQRPRDWRHWRRLPPRGGIAVMFGGWYFRPMVDRAFGDIDDAQMDEELSHVKELERMLTDDGALIVKFWFHLSKASQKERIKKPKKHWKRSSLEKLYQKHYDAFARIAERGIRMTDTGACPWYLIEAEDDRHRDLTVGRTLLEAIERRLREGATVDAAAVMHKPPAPVDAAVTILDHVDLSPTLAGKEYKKQLNKYQGKLNELAWAAYEQGRSGVVVFEGWDAAGKGGAIRRMTVALDPRLYRAVSVATPTDEEKAHHYLWRFWRHIPRGGYLTVYDRSWYGRVLVERVEGFAAEAEWMRAYQEINDFENQLCEHGIVLAKFWFHISPEEQLRRFREREDTPWKQHKLSEEDWRNREKWDDYKAAVNDMVVHTSTSYAPWSLIPGDDKKYARVEILKTLCARLEQELD